MKKLIGFIKSKEANEKTASTEKKALAKDKKVETAPATTEPVQEEQHDLFWDGYSDIGYC